MQELIIHLRAMSLFAHNAHHHVARAVFFQDHEYFGDLYPALTADYDSVTERAINLYGEKIADLSGILLGVMNKLKGAPSVGVLHNIDFFKYQMQLEKELCSLIQRYINDNLSEGTRQLLGDIANKSESRQYLIGRRLK